MGLCKDGYWRETESYEGKQYIGCGKTQKDALKNLAQKITNAQNGTSVLNKIQLSNRGLTHGLKLTLSTLA